MSIGATSATATQTPPHTIDVPTDVAETARMIAAQARSLRHELLQGIGRPATLGDVANAAELIENLAEDVVDLARLTTALLAAARQ